MLVDQMHAALGAIGKRLRVTAAAAVDPVSGTAL